jgi:hypothetical protein
MVVSATIEVTKPAQAELEIAAEPNSSIRVSKLISALSYALDLTEGRLMGHTCAELPDRDANRRTYRAPSRGSG